MLDIYFRSPGFLSRILNRMGPYTPAEKSQLKTISTDVISTADKEIALHYKLKIFVNIKKTREQSKAMGIKLIYLWMNISLLHWNQFDLFVNEHFPSLKSIGSICEWTLIFTEINLTYICEWTFSFTDINLIYLWMNTSLHWKQFNIFVNEHFSSLKTI